MRTDVVDDPVFENCLRSNYELQREPRNIETRSAVIHMGMSMTIDASGSGVSSTYWQLTQC